MSTSTKTILWSVSGIILLAAAFYMVGSKKKDEQGMTSEERARSVTQENSSVPTTAPPAKDASSEAIIDYLVDGQSNDDTKSAEASIDNTSPASQGETTINTNF